MKRDRRPLTGVLLFDKDLGLSSNAALTKLKYLFNALKAGHTGTLDPFASGLLPVCFGEASKFASYMLDADKTYEATIRLGRTTTTGDREGEVLQESHVTLTAQDVSLTLPHFLGQLKQMPPMHSALKFQGQPLYLLARQGIEIKREPRDIFIYQLDLLDFSAPLLKLRVKCSKGTYIRVLAEDIGKSLGCGGMLQDLRRIATGGFKIDKAYSIGQLSEMDAVARDACLITPDNLISHLPEIVLNGQYLLNLVMGKSCVNDLGILPGLYRLYSNAPKVFIGLIECNTESISCKRMMSPEYIKRRDLN